MRRIRDEHGVVAIVVALITCAVLIPIAAVAVDLGVQRVARRDMQAPADVVALDLSRQLDGRSVAQITGASPSLQSLANASMARNNTTVGNGTTVTWRWTIHPRSGLTAPLLPVFGWLWKGYARQSLAELSRQLVH